jgi:hypothetical protein
MTSVSDQVDVPLLEEHVSVLEAQDQGTEVNKFVSTAPVDQSAYEPAAPSYAIAPSPGDGGIDEFLARPVLISSFTWTAETPALGTAHIDPWTLWMNHSTTRNKFANYHYIRGNLCLKFQINGTSFHYGRMMISYEPALGETAHGLFPKQGHSTLTHVIIDPSTNVEGRMRLPFMSPKTWIDTSLDGSQWLGQVHFDQLAPLTWSNGTLTTDLEIQVYAWMEDMEMAYPTADALPVYTPQAGKGKGKRKGNTQAPKSEMDEENPNQGLISRPANTVASVAAHLTEVPIIGPFAKATEMGATALAQIAGLFGYSRPRVLDPPTRVYATSAPVMAATDVADNSLPLSVGAKSELTIDPKASGDVVSEDQLTVGAIAGKWSLWMLTPGPPRMC